MNNASSDCRNGKPSPIPGWVKAISQLMVNQFKTITRQALVARVTPTPWPPDPTISVRLMCPRG